MHHLHRSILELLHLFYLRNDYSQSETILEIHAEYPVHLSLVEFHFRIEFAIFSISMETYIFDWNSQGNAVLFQNHLSAFVSTICHAN